MRLSRVTCAVPGGGGGFGEAAEAEDEDDYEEDGGGVVGGPASREDLSRRGPQEGIMLAPGPVRTDNDP